METTIVCKEPNGEVAKKLSAQQALDRVNSPFEFRLFAVNFLFVHGSIWIPWIPCCQEQSVKEGWRQHQTQGCFHFFAGYEDVEFCFLG